MSMFEPLLPGQKPVGPVEIDRSNPLTDGIKYVWLTDSKNPRELITGTPFTTYLEDASHRGGFVTSRLGQAFEFDNLLSDATPNDRINTNLSHSFTEFSCIILLEVRNMTNSTSVYTEIFSRGSIFENNSNFVVGLRKSNIAANQQLTAYSRSSGGTINGAAQTVSLSVGDLVCLGVSWDSSGNVSLYLDGAQIATASSQTLYSGGSQTMWIGRGNSPSSTARGCDDTVSAVMAFDKALSASEHSSLGADPYQFLRPVSRPQLIINTQPTPLTYEYTVPDPKWEEPALLAGKKPTGPVVVDFSHPLARGLVACFMPVGDRTIDVARRAPALAPTTSSNTYPEATNLGMGVTIDSTYTDGLEGDFQIESLTEYSYGINAKLITLTASKRKFIAGQYQHAGSGYDFGGPYINGDYSLDFYPKNGSNVGSTTKTYSDGEQLQWLGSYKSGETNGAQHFIPGEAVSATVSGSAGTTYDFVIGGKWQNLLQASSTILIVPVWNRALTQAEAERWFADPYQFLLPA